MTPEGKVKRAVSALLKEYAPRVYVFMPVPGGYGESSLDYIFCVGGRFGAIETKAPGKKPTERQMQVIARIERAGGKCFVIDDVSSPQLTALREYVEACLAISDMLDGMFDPSPTEVTV
jgi:hypothetical protein